MLAVHELRKMQTRAVANMTSAGLLDREVKFYDQGVGPLALDSWEVVSDTTWTTCEAPTLGNTGCLNSVPKGDGPSDRIGKKITMKSIQIQGVISTADGDGVEFAQVQPTVLIALVVDEQTNATPLNPGQIYINLKQNVNLNASPMRNMSYTMKYKVLKKKVIVMRSTYWGATIGTAQGEVDNAPPDLTSVISDVAAVGKRNGYVQPFSMYCSLEGMHTNFTAASSTGLIGTIVDNSIHLIANCNVNTSVQGPTAVSAFLTYQSRLRFIG